MSIYSGPVFEPRDGGLHTGGREELRDGVLRPPALHDREYGVQVDAVLARPLRPCALDAGGGRDEHAVEVEQQPAGGKTRHGLSRSG